MTRIRVPAPLEKCLAKTTCPLINSSEQSKHGYSCDNPISGDKN
jgi:hypothetical protein